MDTGDVEDEFAYLNIWYTNADFLTNKFNTFKHRVTTSNPDIIAVVETAFQSDPLAKNYFPDEVIQLEGYDIHRRDNSFDVKGGILVYTSHKLTVSEPPSKKLRNLSAEIKECIYIFRE